MSGMLRRQEAEDHFGKRHESIWQEAVMPDDFGNINCLASVTATAANTLCGLDGESTVSERNVLESLPIPYDLRYFSLALMSLTISSLVSAKGLRLYWYQTEIGYKKELFVQAIKDHLEAGELLHLSVYGDQWRREVYGNKECHGMAHAVLVTGLSSHPGEINLQVCDPMTRSCREVPVMAAFRSVFGSGLGPFGSLIPFWGTPLGVFGA